MVETECIVRVREGAVRSQRLHRLLYVSYRKEAN